MLVAMPTAMPEQPFSSRKGSWAGRTVGSCWDPSKFGAKSTVSSPISSSIAWWEMGARRVSVYRIAAGGSSSTEPKLPWPSSSGMTAGEGLNKPHQGVIDRLITVGVVLA